MNFEKEKKGLVRTGVQVKTPLKMERERECQRPGPPRSPFVHRRENGVKGERTKENKRKEKKEKKKKNNQAR